MQFKQCKIKRTFVVRLDAGEDILKTLTKMAEENGIKAGTFSLIGGLKKLSCGLFDNGVYHNIIKEAKKYCFELLPTGGNITMKEGKIFVHCHIIAANEEDGTATGGHLLEGTIVYPTAEVVMQELDADIDRAYDAESKFWPMKL